MDFLLKYKEQLTKACEKAKVDELFVFGSVLTNSFNSESDIDFVVTLISSDPIEYGENYFQLKFDLESIFNRKIDLLEQKAIGNQFFKSLIDKQKKLVYASRNKGLA